jgi:aryl sulfotransferase
MLSPWLDMRFVPLEVFLNGIEAQTSRRFLKTHLPMDGMRFEPGLKYIYVPRDGRDVFMSLWNNYSKMKRSAIDHMNGIPGRVGDALPYPPADIYEFWNTWVNDSWFENKVGG